MIESLFVGETGMHSTVWQGVVRECLQADSSSENFFFFLKFRRETIMT